jgi:hypothetical protein
MEGERDRRRRRLTAGAVAGGLIVIAAFLLGSPADSGRHRRTAAAITAPRTATATATGPPVSTATSSAPATGQPAPSIEAFGASVNRLFNDGGYTPAQIGAQLQALHDTGATLARSDALWEASEPAAPVDGVHHYDWSFDDRIAGALAEHGLTWLAILDYSAPWAPSVPGQDHSPPRSDADYAAYAGAFAARFGTGGTFWREHPGLPRAPVTTIEIWNEPDNGEFWTPAPDPSGYADLYLAARAAIDTADPSARVIVGGLTRPTAFLPEMVRARPELTGHVDGIAIHPYGAPAVVLTKVRGARAALDSLGMAAVPLYVTEFGWTTDPAGALGYVPATRRAAFIIRTLAALGHLDCGLAAGVLYTWVTPQRNPGDSGDWYGIHDPDGTGTRDTVAFATGLRAATRAAPSRKLCSG